MKFQTHQIEGRGRGKFLGFPTINMEIPKDLDLAEGIHAVWVTIEHETFKGAMHYGPIPTFSEIRRSLEVFLLDITEKKIEMLNTSVIKITPVKRIREVRAFSSKEELIAQMTRDVARVRLAFPAR